MGKNGALLAALAAAIVDGFHPGVAARMQVGRSSARAGPQMHALPADVKGLVEEIRVATQEALTARLSRIDVELPLGMGLMSGEQAQDIHASSRELARVYCEMFSQLEATSVVAFGTEALALEARKAWGNAVRVKCVALTAGTVGKKERALPAPGFGASPASDKPAKKAPPGSVPAGTEIVFAVGPFDPPALAAVEGIARGFGMDTLVVLLNAHLDNADQYASAAQRDFFQGGFARVFCFRPLKTSSDPPQELLVYRAHPGQWTLARMRASGRPQAIAEQPGLFAREEIEQALSRAGPPAASGALEAIGNFFGK
ncbi:hypothetical protein T492DRAFT_1006650 [Pavlovales sp. CCMP2436]|nr:hypothetical protein T492DRAFT_1006650 [Pavlovales sp. CCMP2436]